MNRLRELAAGERPVYVATRLYEPAGRYLGARLERGCLAGLRRALGADARGPLTFLPFRDSNGALQNVPEGELSRRIFALDSRRVRGAYALLSALGDLQLDSGVAFEIGLAAASGVPVELLGLNFFKLRYPEEGRDRVLPPLLELLADRVHYLGEFAPAGDAGYLAEVEAHLERLERAAAGICHRWATAPPQTVRPLPPAVGGRGVFLEFGDGRSEAREFWADRAAALLGGRGWRVYRSRRHGPGGDRAQATAADLRRAAASRVVVVWADGNDVDAESAALQGYVYALGRRVILYGGEKRRVYAGPGYDNRFNLMLSCSAAAVVDRLEDLPAAVG